MDNFSTISKRSSRFLSLDILRGMTVCFMIIVNNSGSATPFAPLMHSRWNGLTPTDLVFPSFLFIVGNAMSFSMKHFQALSNTQVVYKVLKRTVIMFLIGYLMYWFPFFSFNNGHVAMLPIGNTRIMGVLQRIALCYCFASLIIYFLPYKKVIILSVLLLLGYWSVLLIYGNSADPFSITGNAVVYLDKFVFGDAHLYHRLGVSFDPEGLLSTMPAIVNVIIGYYAGKFIQNSGKNYETIAKLLLTGALLILLAICWNPVFPVNKKIWTSTFVLLTSGLDLVILSVLIYALEIKNWNKYNWTDFFTPFGKNPLFVYLVSEILIEVFRIVDVKPGISMYSWINTAIYEVISPGAIGSLLFALSYMLICWFVGWVLDKKAIYFRI